MIKPYVCTQCESTDFEEEENKIIKCKHCGCKFQVITYEPTVVINKKANVVFGKNANVEIRGGVEIKDEANVNIQGKVIVEKGSKKKQKFKLVLLKS